MNRPLRVFVSGPISRGDLAGNVNQATAAFVELARLGFAPFCPHWSVYSGEARRFDAPFGPMPVGSVYAVAGVTPNALGIADWLRVDLAWVRVADAVLRLPGESPGADLETAEARRCNVPVFSSVADLMSWVDAGALPEWAHGSPCAGCDICSTVVS